MDLHPLNVMVGPRGPVVIDWANAAAGEAAVDVALAWVLIRAGQLPDWQPAAAVEGALRSVVLGGFLRGVDRSPSRRWRPRSSSGRRATRTSPSASEATCAGR